MKIAISATDRTLDAEVDPRFGRCQYFILIDTETMQFEAIENASSMAAGGAGISAAQTVADKGVQAVLTGNCGPNAHQVLSAAGVQVITGVSGKVKDAIQSYKSGQFQTSSQANVPDHFGMSYGGGAGGGAGGGMGTGMMPPFSPTSQPLSQEQGLDDLKTQSQMLAQQLSAMQQRIDELEKRK